MNAKKMFAVAMFVSTGAAFAAEAPAAAASTVAAATVSASASALNGSATAAASMASKLNLPALGAPSQAPRDGVKAEARDALSQHKTTLAVQLDQYKN